MKTLQQRFDAKYIPEPNSGCWLWFGSFDGCGYGQLRIDDRLKMATHVSLELDGRPVPKGLCACHRCDTPACVNPGHLFVGTRKENTQDAMRKGRAHKPPIAKKGQRQKALCNKGHPLAGDNLYELPSGYRACRACRVEWKRGLRARRHAAGLTAKGTAPVLQAEAVAP